MSSIAPTRAAVAEQAALDALRTLKVLSARTFIAIMRDPNHGGLTNAYAYRIMMRLQDEGVIVRNDAHWVDARTYRLAGQVTQ